MEISMPTLLICPIQLQIEQCNEHGPSLLDDVSLLPPLVFPAF